MSFVIYKSSAGSGKTYTLVKEYLRITLQNPDNFNRILAITFTNKAAGEMKERVLLYLQKMANFTTSPDNKYQDLFNELQEEGKLNEQEITTNAKKVIENILHRYAEFSVSTIDSFVHRIVKAFTYELKVPYNFAVEMDEDMLLEAVQLLINNASKDKEIKAILVEIINDQIEEGKSWDVESIIFECAKLIIDDSYCDDILAIQHLNTHEILAIRNQLYKLISQTYDAINNQIKNLLAEFEKDGLQDDDFTSKSKGIASFFKNIIKNKFELITITKTINNIVAQENYFQKNVNTTIVNKYTPIITRTFHDVINANKIAILYFYFFKQCYLMALLNAVSKEFEEIRKRKNALHISDFNKKIADIVLNEQVPYIYERLGEKYQHYLIDEFQDTNLLQWQNLLPLIENSLASGYFNMIVGDGKQAIYRFRGGEVDQFIKLPKPSPKITNPLSIERYKQLENNSNTIPLGTNYRSLNNIVQFNNDFFEKIKEYIPNACQDIYYKHEQNPQKEKIGGYVEISFIAEEKIKQNDMTMVLETVNKLKEQGYNYNDICILTRSNKNGSKIAAMLMQNNINVFSNESLLLSNAPCISFIESVLRYFCYSNEILPKIEVISYLKKFYPHLYEESLEKLTNIIILTEKEKANNEKTNQYALFTSAFEELVSRSCLGFNQLLEKSLNLYDLCERIISGFKFSESDNAYLVYFLEAVYSFCNEKNGNLNDFLIWWDANKSKKSIQVSEGIDAVKIMTIHKSKGLDFPVVICFFNDEGIKTPTNLHFVKYKIPEINQLDTFLLKGYKNLENTPLENVLREEMNLIKQDLINLIYVAFTRAEEQLYIFSKQPKKDSDDLKSVQAYLKKYLELIRMWQDEQETYSFGEIVTKQNKDKKNHQTETLKLNELHSNFTTEKLLIRSDFENLWKINFRQQAIDWGNLVHDILSKCYYFSQLDDVILDFLQFTQLCEDEVNYIKRIITNLMLHPDLTKYFDETKIKNVLTEKEIISSDGSIFRPDRIVVLENEVSVMDFKTGKVSIMHEKQIQQYANLLKELGYQNIKLFVIYMHEDKIIVNKL